MASLVESATGEQVVLSTHKVRVASNTSLLIQPRENLVKESSSSSGVGSAVDISGESKLGDPDLRQAVLGSSVNGLGDEGLEIIGSVTVPVNGQTGNTAAAAATDERLEPVKADSGLGRGGYGGRNQLRLAGPRGDVGLVVAGSIGGAHVSLRSHVGLVESENVAAAAGQSGLDGGHPATEHLGAPEHRDKLDVRGERAREGAGPVVGPRDGATIGQSRHGSDIVVGGTALAGGAALGLHGGGHSRSGDEAGSEKLGERDHFE